MKIVMQYAMYTQTNIPKSLIITDTLGAVFLMTMN